MTGEGGRKALTVLRLRRRQRAGALEGSIDGLKGERIRRVGVANAVLAERHG